MLRRALPLEVGKGPHTPRGVWALFVTCGLRERELGVGSVQPPPPHPRGLSEWASICSLELGLQILIKIVTNSYACKTLRSKRCYVGSVMLKPHGFSVGHVFRVKAFTRCSDNSKRVKNLHLGSRVSRSGGILFSVRTSVISPGGVQTVFKWLKIIALLGPLYR